MYEYRAEVISVVDGDTVHLAIDAGMDLHVLKTIRLFGIDAPETSTPEGKASKDYLTKRLPVGTEVILLTVKDKREKFGRYLGTLLLGDENLNLTMVERDYAKFYDGGRRSP